MLVSSTFIHFTQVLVSYIQELIANSKPKSCVLDPVPTTILKQAQEVLVGPLTDIINASLQTGVFPTAFKKGVAHPSLKKSKRNYEQYSSYRPITNIAFLSKTIERVATTQTMNYLADNDLLPKFQSGYRPHHSTETTLACVFNDILKAIDQHQEIVLVRLDLSSAFDTIDHGALLTRLREHYGFAGKLLSWFESYLTNRVQSVIINDTQSSELPVALVRYCSPFSSRR